MPLMDWTEKMSVGIAQFDKEHHGLVDLINELFDAVQAGRGREKLGGTLTKLLDYTKTHMLKEEQILERYGYPDLEPHRQEHKAIVRRIVGIRQRYESGATGPMCMEVLALMKSWLTDHILGTDKKYQSFLNGKGLR
ncbi:MAG: bacteriohemerythrin [Rhodospirillaceae bacterium]